MKRHLTVLVLCLVMFFFSVAVRAQGTFQNLGFESALIVPIPGDLYGSVQFAPAFPGWTGYIGGVQQTNALYNFTFLDTSAISLVAANPLGWPIGVIEGNYTAILQAGIGNGGPAADTALVQIGLVPVTAQTLMFRALLDGLDSLDSLAVTLGGQTLTVIPMAPGSPYFTLYGADIHSWAGQTAELGFTVFAQRPHRGNNTLFLDSITFSDQPVPEPTVLGLFAVGVLLLGWRLRRLKR